MVKRSDPIDTVAPSMFEFMGFYSIYPFLCGRYDWSKRSTFKMEDGILLYYPLVLDGILLLYYPLVLVGLFVHDLRCTVYFI